MCHMRLCRLILENDGRMVRMEECVIMMEGGMDGCEERMKLHLIQGKLSLVMNGKPWSRDGSTNPYETRSQRHFSWPEILSNRLRFSTNSRTTRSLVWRSVTECDASDVIRPSAKLWRTKLDCLTRPDITWHHNMTFSCDTRQYMWPIYIYMCMYTYIVWH